MIAAGTIVKSSDGYRLAVRRAPSAETTLQSRPRRQGKYQYRDR
jgi:hypothetical protein